ncbi:hypothetical protein RRG08_049224 [Elysia crispata]|uniref:Uncharacterized protein n=1 Tax=Elysia crispata TaxID=231223 RepID=A0AAE1D4D9_9GAST|nr:hypothetical protein RRG08_049224 [Elysia crispata]
MTVLYTVAPGKNPLEATSSITWSKRCINYAPHASNTAPARSCDGYRLPAAGWGRDVSLLDLLKIIVEWINCIRQTSNRFVFSRVTACGSSAIESATCDSPLSQDLSRTFHPMSTAFRDAGRVYMNDENFRSQMPESDKEENIIDLIHSPMPFCYSEAFNPTSLVLYTYSPMSSRKIRATRPDDSRQQVSEPTLHPDWLAGRVQTAPGAAL